MVRNTLNVPRSLFVGFDTLFEDLERIHASARSGNDNYPPHNVWLTGKQHQRAHQAPDELRCYRYQAKFGR